VLKVTHQRMSFPASHTSSPSFFLGCQAHHECREVAHIAFTHVSWPKCVLENRARFSRQPLRSRSCLDDSDAKHLFAVLAICDDRLIRTNARITETARPSGEIQHLSTMRVASAPPMLQCST
jgi:hypothetical protein